MSKIYKSNCVSVGAPKPIVNVFKSEAKIKTETEPAAEEEYNSSCPEEDADSIIEDAKQMYLKIIEEANSEAHRIVEAAEADAENFISASRDSGYKEGFETGYIEGKKKAQSIIDDASEIRRFLEARKEELFKEAEEQILRLVLNIAKKVIGEEITQNREALLSIVHKGLQKCTFRKKLVLKVSPEDSDFIIENKDRICMTVEGISDIDIVSDLSLAKGSCIIETPSGEVDSSIDVQIEEIEKIFTYLLRNE